jgi:hypothetical protein
MQDNEERAIVKGSVPRSLKLQFKILCTEKELEMSSVLECMIRRWIHADAPISDISKFIERSNRLNEVLEDVKGYIPKSLKIQFKLCCVRRRVKIRDVLYKLINEWIQAGAPPPKAGCPQQPTMSNSGTI